MDPEILTFIVIGFLAQMVDGALGMAFGVIASSSLIAIGAPPAIASAAIHAAEIVTSWSRPAFAAACWAPTC
jgi:uncharacterized membrane protein YfcA